VVDHNIDSTVEQLSATSVKLSLPNSATRTVAVTLPCLFEAGDGKYSSALLETELACGRLSLQLETILVNRLPKSSVKFDNPSRKQYDEKSNNLETV
jgi:hypothetical protein